jgi:hypothetical protein
MDHLFQTMISYRNFYSAYLKSIYCRRFKPEILKFSFNTEKQLLYIIQKITSHKYIHGGYFKFIVNDSKKRTI